MRDSKTVRNKMRVPDNDRAAGDGHASRSRERADRARSWFVRTKKDKTTKPDAPA